MGVLNWWIEFCFQERRYRPIDSNARVLRDVPIVIGGITFLEDLLKLKSNEFDVILGMDWLSKHEAVMDCRAKIILIQSPNGWITFMGDYRNPLDGVVLAAMADKMFKRGCEAFLVHVVQVDKMRSDGKFIPIVNEYFDIFLEEILCLLLSRGEFFC